MAENRSALNRDFSNPIYSLDKPTNIDCRICTRVMPLGVLCLGMSRTGTVCTEVLRFCLG